MKPGTWPSTLLSCIFNRIFDTRCERFYFVNDADMGLTNYTSLTGMGRILQPRLAMR